MRCRSLIFHVCHIHKAGAGLSWCKCYQWCESWELKDREGDQRRQSVLFHLTLTECLCFHPILGKQATRSSARCYCVGTEPLFITKLFILFIVLGQKALIYQINEFEIETLCCLILSIRRVFYMFNLVCCSKIRYMWLYNMVICDCF